MCIVQPASCEPVSCTEEHTTAPMRSADCVAANCDAAASSSQPSSSAAVAAQSRSTRAEATVSLLTFAGGSLTSLFGGAVYALCPRSSGNQQVQQAWLTYVMTIGTFGTDALFTSLNAANWRVLREQATPRLAALLLVPSALDVVITGAATVALSLAPPSLVSILKSSMQLLSIALIGRLVQRRRLGIDKLLALWAVAVGVGVVSVSDLIWNGDDARSTSTVQQAAGISLALWAGFLGAWRNILEEYILQEASFPSSALLMCESYWSAIAVAACAPLVAAYIDGATHSGEHGSDGGPDASGALAATLSDPAALLFLLLFWLTAYVKDAGKFWLIKYASALRQKVVAIGFPFGTWACGLLVFYVLGGRDHHPSIGTTWSAPSSGVKLVGFVIILAANAAFLLFKSGHTCASLVAPLRAALHTCLLLLRRPNKGAVELVDEVGAL